MLKDSRLRTPGIPVVYFQVVPLGSKPEAGKIPIDAACYHHAKKQMSREGWRFVHISGKQAYMHPVMSDAYVRFDDSSRTVEVMAPGERGANDLANKLGLKKTSRD